MRLAMEIAIVIRPLPVGLFPGLDPETLKKGIKIWEGKLLDRKIWICCSHEGQKSKKKSDQTRARSEDLIG